MKRIENSKFKIQNYGISFLLVIFSLFRRKTKSVDLKSFEFSTSTQRIGVRFIDKIRDVFRHRWLKVK
jgi:hypothetical protein